MEPQSAGLRTMPGKLDEISVAIGAQGEAVKGLKESFDRHCDDDDRRHEENQQVAKATLAQITGLRDDLSADITALRMTLEPLVASVSVMRPIVDGYQVTRAKLAVWGSIGISILILLGWVLEAGVKWFVTWAFGHWH